MNVGMDPQIAEALQHAAAFQSALDEQLHQMGSTSFRGTDEAGSVVVTINGSQSLTGVYLEPGLLRRNGEVVGQRINEALQNAQAAAAAARETRHERLLTLLADITRSLEQTLASQSI